jgi:glutamine amidotransferase
MKEGVQPRVTKNVSDLTESDALLLPGVGSFTQATKKLPVTEVLDLVHTGKPLLGICLGLQLFFEESEEGQGKGLSLLPGSVKRLPNSVKIPQIGWNTLKMRNYSELTDGLPDESWVYYVHSYYPATKGSWVTATSEYGIEYPCLISWKNVFGTQFHPEKSGRTGRMILQNLLRAIKR